MTSSPKTPETQTPPGSPIPFTPPAHPPQSHPILNLPSIHHLQTQLLKEDLETYESHIKSGDITKALMTLILSVKFTNDHSHVETICHRSRDVIHDLVMCVMKK